VEHSTDQLNHLNFQTVNTFHREKHEMTPMFYDSIDLIAWAINREDVDLVEFHFQHVRSILPMREVGPNLEDEMVEVISEAVNDRYPESINLRAKSRDGKGRVAIGVPRSKSRSPWMDIQTLHGKIKRELEKRPDNGVFEK
jgi:hypothetical protein